jgi:hypothetical protein
MVMVMVMVLVMAVQILQGTHRGWTVTWIPASAGMTSERVTTGGAKQE